MNRMGRIASGGIIERTAIRGDRVARSIGKAPEAMLRPRPARAATAMPSAMRVRLASVSDQSSTEPVRASSVKAIRAMASSICATLGNRRSSGLSASRADEATT